MNATALNLQHFAEELGLKFVFDKLPHDSMATFRVESTGATSLIDHFGVSQSLYTNLGDVHILDNCINLSDHCPLAIAVNLLNTASLFSQLSNTRQKIEQMNFR